MNDRVGFVTRDPDPFIAAGITKKSQKLAQYKSHHSSEMTSVFCLSRTESKTAGKSGIRQTVRLTSTALRQCIFSPILKKLLSFARRVAIGPHNCCTAVEACPGTWRLLPR